MNPVGLVFNRLRVVSASHVKGRLICICVCTCGGSKSARYNSLERGDTQSCGCLASELVAERNRTHSDSLSPEWITWRSMRQRCEYSKHKSFDRYGGRGIRVCERWQSFENFLSDVGRRPSPSMQIERIDNDGNYEPGNVRWATRSEQARNRSDRSRLPNGQFAPKNAAGESL